MRAVDTNVLVRFFERDDRDRTAAADEILLGRDPVFISNIVLCELGWVLRSTYGRGRGDIATIMRALLGVETMIMDRDAVLNGLAILEAGADFSDGVILYEARRARCNDLATFDRRFAKHGTPDVTLIS